MLIKHKHYKVLISGLIVIILLLVSLSWAQDQSRVKRIVVFKESFKDMKRQEALIKRFDGEIVKPLPLVNGTAITIPLSAERKIQQRREVLRVDYDAKVYALKKPDQSIGKLGKPKPQPPQVLPWGINRIDAEYAWMNNLTGAGVKVAVLDTGIDYTHPDLMNNCKGGINLVNPRKDYKDDNGHGSFVAGIIAAEDNDIGIVGMAPEAWLYGVKVLGASGSGYISDIIDGISWSIENGMDIINMSLGSDYDIQSLHDACDTAANAGIYLVAAAGNDGGAVDYPGAYDSVIAVAATDINDVRPSWSSYGNEVDITGPGVRVYSAWKNGGYKTASGTSASAPHVAGTLALNLQADIFGTADDLTPAGWDIYTGYGLVDAGEAATGILNYGDDLP
jgi:subtilisin family serine protease